MASSDAHKRAVTKYNDKTYQKTLIRLKPDLMQAVRDHIAQTGESLNGFITTAITEKLDRDNQNKPE